MKRILLALSLIAAPAVIGQTSSKEKAVTAKCMGPEGKACTAAQVQDLGSGALSGRRVHQSLAAFKRVTLASSDGTLKCEQTDGSPCTAAQLDALNEIAAAKKCSINYNASKANTVK